MGARARRLSAAGPPQGARPLGGAARSAVRGEHASAPRCVAVALVALAGLAGCAGEPPASAVRAAAPPIPFVDAHVHLNDAAMQLDLMSANAIPKAVVFWGRAGDNDTVLAAARAQPDRFIPFASVSPERRAYRDLWARDDPALVRALEAALESGGFRGIGEISVSHFPGAGFPEADFSPAGPAMAGIMDLARRYRLPVLVHCEITRMAELEALLAAHRDVAVIWAHGGYTPYFLARRFIERHPNLTYELSARTWRHHPRSPEYTIFMTDDAVWPEWLKLIEDHPTRFVVGTDAGNHSRAADQQRIDSVRALLAQLPEPARSLVARENLLRLVGAR